MNGAPPAGWPPSALERWEEIAGTLAGRRPALFLDYDGTLTPIVERPEDAELPASRRELLRRLASRCPTAIVSGRARRDVERKVELPGVLYAGSHGFDIAGPAGAVELAPARRAEPLVAAAADEIEARLATVEGAQVERKGPVAAIHYRRVAPGREAEVERAVDRAIAARPGLRKSGGKKVFEVRPDVDWDKGKALLWLLATLGLESAEVLPVYIGDDVTDEDAFAALAGRGLGVVVGATAHATRAAFSLRDPDEVESFLRRLLALLTAGTGVAGGAGPHTTDEAGDNATSGRSCE